MAASSLSLPWSSACQLVSTFCFFIAIFVPTWVKCQGDSYGVFFKRTGGYHTMQCTLDVSHYACTLLNASKISAVLAFLAGFFAFMSMFTQKSNKLRDVYEIGFNAAQFAFAIILISIYPAFCKAFLVSNDDVNFEDDKAPSHFTYKFGFGIWVLGIIGSFAGLAFNARAMYNKNGKYSH